MPVSKQCLNTEEIGLMATMRWVEQQSRTCIKTSDGMSKNELQKFLQSTIGDLIVIDQSGFPLGSIEVKAEESASENFFVETWSNFGAKQGWLFTCEALYLAYYFIESQSLTVLFLEKFREWVKKNAYKFREVPQRKHNQLNQTRGLLVPIEQIPATIIRDKVFI